MVYNDYMSKKQKPKKSERPMHSQSVRFNKEIEEEIREYMEEAHESSFNKAVVKLVEIGLRETYWETDILEEARIKRDRAANELLIFRRKSKKERTGERFIRLGKMTKAQAEEVLRRQQTEFKGKRFGEIAMELMFINQADLEAYLNEKDT